MITADQMVLHLVGDYLLQSDWMANNKTKEHIAAVAHALVYSFPFLLFRPSLAAWLVIFVTHFFIDRYRLARYVVWAKNWLGPATYWKETAQGWSNASNQLAALWMTWQYFGTPEICNAEMEAIKDLKKLRMLPFSVCSGTGYPPDRPAWLAVWLLIIADNILHIVINGAALKFL